MTATTLDYLDAVHAASLDRTPPPPSGLPRAIRALDVPPFQPPQWLIQDLLPLGLPSLIVGDGGTFKSSLALHIAGAIAGGYAVFDKYATLERPVLVVSAEDDLNTVAMRVEAFVAGHGWERKRVMNNLHLIATSEAALTSRAWMRHIRQECERIEPGLIVLDPWADLLGAEENSNTEVRPAIKYVRSLIADNNRSVLIVHHMGKAGPDKRTLDRIRGASALPSAARAIFSLDWHDHAVTVENVKMSRAEVLPKFVIERHIVSAPSNRAHWYSALLTTQDARQYRASRSDRWVLEYVAHWPGVGTRELRQGRETTAPRNADIQYSIAELTRNGYLSQTPGKQRKLHLNLTSSGDQLLEKIAAERALRSSGTHSEKAAQTLGDTSGTHSTGGSGGLTECVPCVPSVSPHTSEGSPGAHICAHPLKGVVSTENVGEAFPGLPDARDTLQEDALDFLSEISERTAIESEGEQDGGL